MKNKKDEKEKVGTEIVEPVGTKHAGLGKHGAIDINDNSEAGGKPVGTLFDFELPEVSEQTDDFIQADIIEDENPDSPVAGFSENAEAEKHRGALDDKGNPYDPLIHFYPPEKTGKLQKWKKLPKRKTEEKAVDDVKSNAAYRGEAQKFATLYGESHRLIFGQGGHVEKDELIPLVDSLERYMLENGHTELSAGWDVLLSSGMYSFAITQRETNKEKVKKLMASIINPIKNLFGFKKKDKKEMPENVRGNE